MDSQADGRSLWWMRDAKSGAITLRGWLGLPPPVEYIALLNASRDSET